jgi:hypothetical protein
MLANLVVALIVIAAGAHFYARYLKPGKASGCGSGSSSACSACNACDTPVQETMAAPGGRRVIQIKQHRN